MFTRLFRGLNNSLFSTLRIEAPKKYVEPFNRARNIMDLYDLKVYNEGFVFLAPNATLVGDIFLGADIAIWNGTVIRGDINRVMYFKFYSVSLKISVLEITVFCILLPLLLQD